MIQILKYNDAELCPRPNQRTCWGHFGSSRGQDSAYRRSSSLYIHHPTIPNPHSVHLRFYNKQTNVHNSVHLKQIIQEIKTCNCSSIDVKLCQVLGEGNFGKVWKAEVDDICGYEGTILVAVKGVKASRKNKQRKTQTLTKIQILTMDMIDQLSPPISTTFES